MRKDIPENILKRVSISCISVIFIIGIYGIIGRLFGLTDFFHDNLNIVPISPFASLSYVLIGIDLFLFCRKEKDLWSKWLVKGITLFVMAISLAICIAFVANQDYDFQKALLGWAIEEEDLQGSSIGPFAAFGIFLGSIAICFQLLSKTKESIYSSYLIGTLGITVFSIGAINILGYVYGTPELYGGSDRPVSIASALGLLFFGIAIVANMDPKDWLVKIVFAQESRYILIKYLVPFIAIIILIISWVISVFIPQYENVLLLTAMFDILAVIFVSILVSHLSEIIDGRLKRLRIERDRALEDLKIANEKLLMLGTLTRHDILNQLSLLKMEAELAKRYDCDPIVTKGLDNITRINKTIEQLLKFQKEYQLIGQEKDRWLNLKEVLSAVISHFDLGKIGFEAQIESLSIFADPMIEKALYNIIENSLRHGGTVTKIIIRTEHGPDGSFKIVIEDNGIGIENSEKERIFLKDIGRNTGLGLFLSREILKHSEMTIKEAGRFGKGARFEISVPRGRWESIKAG